MIWDSFIWYAIPSILLWAIAGIFIYKKSLKGLSEAFVIGGIIILAVFIAMLWNSLQRPPLKTMGETRLWYSFFISLIGYITYKRWNYKWLISYTSLVAIVFIMINLLKPEIHSKNLMPALQSNWFVPHVTVYILSYSMLGAATIAALILLRKLDKNNNDRKLEELIDNLVYSGFGFLMLGMLMGTMWAKDAWGNYWSWDPKETWAFITATTYLIYIHLRMQKGHKKLTLWVLVIALILLIITWLGVSYLPSAQGSVHTY